MRLRRRHGAVVAEVKTLSALRSFMWAVVSLQCTVRKHPRNIKISNLIPNLEATESFKYRFLNFNNFSRTDLVPNLILLKNSGAKKRKALGFPLGATQELFKCQTQSGGGCLTIYLIYGLKRNLDHFKENPNALG